MHLDELWAYLCTVAQFPDPPRQAGASVAPCHLQQVLLRDLCREQGPSSGSISGGMCFSKIHVLLSQRDHDLIYKWGETSVSPSVLGFNVLTPAGFQSAAESVGNHNGQCFSL